MLEDVKINGKEKSITIVDTDFEETVKVEPDIGSGKIAVHSSKLTMSVIVDVYAKRNLNVVKNVLLWNEQYTRDLGISFTSQTRILLLLSKEYPQYKNEIDKYLMLV